MKGIGYVVSCASVALLIIPPLRMAREDPLILSCLLGGALLSVIGMYLRWLADQRTQRRISRAQAKGEAALRGGAGVVEGN